jgi:HlyD family secretion protein
LKQILSIGLAIIILASLVGYITLTSLSEKRPQKPVCRSVEVQRGNIQSSVYGQGTVKPKQLFHIKARLPGRIKAILVQKNETVIEKQRLIRIEPESGFTVELDQLRYNLYTTRLQRQAIENNLNKQRKLFKRGMVAKTVIEELQRSLTKAGKEENLVLKRLKVLEEETGQSLIGSKSTAAPQGPVDIYILSPSAGTVLDINKQVGDVITMGNKLPIKNEEEVAIVLADLSDIFVKCKVNEIDIKDVQIGQAAMVRLEAQPDKTYVGIIEKISAIAGPQTQASDLTVGGLNYFTVLIKLNDRDALVRPGMTCNVQIVIREKKAVLLLPVESVAKEKKQEFIFHETKSSFERKTVTTGLSNEHQVEIMSGLAEKEIVCDGPLAILEWQDQVRHFEDRNFIEKLLR